VYDTNQAVEMHQSHDRWRKRRLLLDLSYRNVQLKQYPAASHYRFTSQRIEPH